MKTLFTLFFILSGISLFAQEESKVSEPPSQSCSRECKKKCCKKKDYENVITLDFNKKKIYGLEELKLKRGGLYYFNIENINRNVYKIQVDNQDTTVIQPLDFSLFSALDPSSISGLIGSINSTSKTLEYESRVVDLVNDTLELNDTPEQRLEYYNNLSKEIEGELKSASETFAVDLKTWEGYFKKAYLIDNNFEMDFSKTENIGNEFSSFRDKLEKSSDTTASLKKEFDAFIKSHGDQLNTPDLKEKKEKILARFSTLHEVIKKQEENVSEEKQEVLISKYVDLINNAETVYHSLPLQFTGDRSEISISITPQDSSSRLPSYNATYQIPKPSNYYIGIGPGIYRSDLMDTNYSAKGVYVNDSLSYYEAVREKGSTYEIGLSIMARAGIKPFPVCEWFGVHAAIGGGLSLTNPTRIRAIYGVGLSFGRKHCLTLDAVWTTGYVNVLSNAVDLSTKYKEVPENSFTVSQLRTKFGLSVGYVFTF